MVHFNFQTIEVRFRSGDCLPHTRDIPAIRFRGENAHDRCDACSEGIHHSAGTKGHACVETLHMTDTVVFADGWSAIAQLDRASTG